MLVFIARYLCHGVIKRDDIITKPYCVVMFGILKFYIFGMSELL